MFVGKPRTIKIILQLFELAQNNIKTTCTLLNYSIRQNNAQKNLS